MRAKHKANLVRLEMKRGWNDGNMGLSANPPTRTIMRGGRTEQIPSTEFETEAYERGYFEGTNSPKHAINPYNQSK
tara:strand:+ start:401 stop:628 length:228 start_codon:yes stop_codon:yes gene_type:complete